jgi:tetratricopeptide (TPR) repeat protein
MKYTLTFICILSWSLFGFAQKLKTPTLSPFTKISQEIGLTEVSLEYSRPSAKGRTVFNDLVPYGKIWRTGANASTKITINEPVRIGGKSVQTGTYALYTIPGKEIWTIIIHANTKLRSLAGDAYNQADDVFRFEVESKKLDHYVETFTLQFSDLQSDSCNLQLIWENTLINIPIEVEVDSKIEKQMTEFMKNPESIPHRTYFEAAQYYLNNEKDLNEALSFINEALEKSPKNFRYGLLKAKILNKSGDREAALVTVDKAHTWAKDANNANYMEQTELFKQSLLDNK